MLFTYLSYLAVTPLELKFLIEDDQERVTPAAACYIKWFMLL